MTPELMGEVNLCPPLAGANYGSVATIKPNRRERSSLKGRSLSLSTGQLTNRFSF